MIFTANVHLVSLTDAWRSSAYGLEFGVGIGMKNEIGIGMNLNWKTKGHSPLYILFSVDTKSRGSCW
uniref:Uncharacterized protein n=1 Tax=Rhizophora mucronata TaxID=61149 RepID=A0A2P2PTN5_RHIMU